MRLHLICDDKQQLMKQLSKYMRWVAKKRSSEKEHAVYGPSRYTPDDEEDIYQLGMLAAWKYIQRQEELGLHPGFQLLRKVIHSALKDAARETGSRPRFARNNEHAGGERTYSVRQHF